MSNKMNKGLSQTLHEALEDYIKTFDSPQHMTNLWPAVIEETEKTLLEFAFKHAQNNKVLASKMLGINRNTFYRKIESYGLLHKKKGA